MLRVILISGKKGAGKDFVAKQLGYKTLSFAAPIKDIIATTLQISLDTLDAMKNDTTTDMRQMLQFFGTEAMHKHFGKEVWVDLACKELDKHSETVVFTDWRFVTEYELLTARGYSVTTLRIDADVADEADQHESEIALDNFDFDFKFQNFEKLGSENENFKSSISKFQKLHSEL